MPHKKVVELLGDKSACGIPENLEAVFSVSMLWVSGLVVVIFESESFYAVAWAVQTIITATLSLLSYILWLIASNIVRGHCHNKDPDCFSYGWLGDLCFLVPAVTLYVSMLTMAFTRGKDNKFVSFPLIGKLSKLVAKKRTGGKSNKSDV
eukprot:TRINITY_DN5725_c0_g1_i2.p1 TRINITY_DN5725_c0_g1~~TRINITY_DN5725_c0_g1_i2.p1  ORF type:complete len:159 (+),score=49.07 TRINITY_DN5725_c0_g1_i2:30-479(+)